MRKIEFRAKRVDGQWLYGDLLRNRGETFIAPDGIQSPLATADDFKVDPETVGQYTGLKDKNGVKIFEGDIIKPFKSFDVLYVVEHFKCGLICKRIDNPLVTVELYTVHGDSEVINNIHSLPEFIKETIHE